MSSAVVTGAAMGIGRAVAERLVDEGTMSSRRSQRGRPRGCTRRARPRLRALRRRHRRLGRPRARRRRCRGSRGLRYWVNNAGIDWVGAAHEIDAEHIEQGLRVLQLGPMFGACVAVRRMLPARAGSIVNVSSIQGIAAFPRYFVYDSAKAAILMADEVDRSRLRPVRDPRATPSCRGASRRR